MSDLISRRELLESFRKSYCGHLGMENSDVMITFRSICRIINEQPTAYDVGKIVEELEKLKDKGSVTKTEMLITKSCIDKAIEIVKQGGASDDVCEWKWGIDYAQVQCKGDKILFGSRRLFNYCPYCGKKIKVVE